jgi:general L-amino acid transport system substrate-binding protein
MKQCFRASGLGLLAGLLVSAAGLSGAWAQGSGSATLDAARGRGEVLCGVAGDVPGFSLPDSQG